ncbi:hypothetical protein ABIA94_009373, partial [Bradyrhizobium sp. LA7.1]
TTRSNQRPDTLMQDRICQVDETSCNARPDHTCGVKSRHWPSRAVIFWSPLRAFIGRRENRPACLGHHMHKPRRRMQLQADLAKGRQDRILFYAFVILFHNGEDLRSKHQIKRKGLLKELIDMLEPPVLYSEHMEGDGQELFEAAARLNYEGIVSRRADAPYRSDRNEA